MWLKMKKAPSIFWIYVFLIFGLNIQIPCLHAQDKQSTLHQIEKLTKVMEENPEQDSLYLSLGNLYLDVEDWGKADDAFKAFLKLHPESVQAYVGRGCAYHGKGEGAFIPLEAIKQLFKIDNYSKAEKEFKRALAIAPDCIEAMYRITLTYLAKGGADNYENAIHSATNALTIDPLYRDSDYLLGIAYQHLKAYDKAEAVLLETIEKQRSIGKAMLRLSEIYMDINQPTKSICYYLDGIIQIKDLETLDLLYSQYESLMSSDQKKEYHGLPVEEKGLFLKRFWKSKDPTPTTDRNERFEEHYRRVQYALTNYFDNIPPYYDDRGKIYIRYGEPDDRFVAQNPSDETKPNESWTYEKSLGPGMTFDFVKKGSAYRQVISLSEAAPAGSSPNAASAYADVLYRERSSLSESYQHLAASVDLSNALIDFEANRSVTQANAPAETFQYELSGDPLNVYYTMARFKASEQQTHTEFYFAIPLNELTFIPNGSQGVRSTVTYTMLVQDTNYTNVAEKTLRMPLLAASAESIGKQFFLHQEDFTLDPGHYRFVVRMENEESHRQCLYVNAFDVESHPEGKLALSDIQLADLVQNAPSQSIRFVKNNLQVVPHPYRIVDVSQPFYVYFEGYNLTLGPHGQSDYELTYSLKMSKVDRSFLSSTIGALGRLFSRESKGKIGSSFIRQGNERDIIEYLSIDLSKVKSGQGDLIIQLTDRQTGKSAEQSISLQLVNPNQ